MGRVKEGRDLGQTLQQVKTTLLGILLRRSRDAVSAEKRTRPQGGFVYKEGGAQHVWADGNDLTPANKTHGLEMPIVQCF